MNPENTTALTKLITNFLRRKHELVPNQQIQLVITKLPLQPVEPVIVRVDEMDEKSIIFDAAKATHKTAIKYGLEEAKISSFEKLDKLTIERFLKMRNVGKVLIQKFAAALKERGHTSPWMSNLPILDGEFAQEVKQAIRVLIIDSEWDAMKNALSHPIRTHTRTHLVILDTLKRSNNSDRRVEDLFPRKYSPKEYRSLLFLMNLRFKNKNLPFRIKFLAEPSDGRFSGEVYIGKLV